MALYLVAAKLGAELFEFCNERIDAATMSEWIFVVMACPFG
ncbi:hypothetical protein [Arthrobacter woluwensis]|nr:hypothetical protein [Arthrobacter woluwensis]